ncbi:RTA-like protein [Suillus subluteus]|nr:RTA-like protein [Suillus subluteus]
MLPTATLAGILEILGWSARLWSSKSPKLITPYEMQLVGTVVAPTPLVAANFIILGEIIGQVGPQFSRLTPKIYTIIFCSFDVICLIVQALGGATAARAGANIMLGGIVAQLFAIVFFLRVKYDAPVRHVNVLVSKSLRIMIYATAFCTLCIFIRSIYRTVELAGGWFGPVITTQRYFDWLDGGMVTLAIYTQNFFHPGIWLNKADTTSESKFYKKKPTTTKKLRLRC